MQAKDLIPGRIYLDDTGSFGEFSRIGGTGWAVCHPPGEPDMQSSWAIKPERLLREATDDEAKAYKNSVGFVDD